VGSLPEILPLQSAGGQAPGARLREAVAAVVGRQRTLGLDVINEGEYTKGGDWLSCPLV
jgi:5-methyltetrahydropteroyltriglutamate--homocysteine methyltransferase